MSQFKTIEYKKLNGTQPVLMDVYSPPLPSADKVVSLPIIVYIHGGALTLGNRQDFFPTWLKDRVLASGYAFVSIDYRLLIPITGKEVVEDIQDAFTFVSTHELPGEGYTFKLDGDRIGVAGHSAGGLAAVLATIHSTPRPKVLVDVYGMGGNFFTGFHLNIKPGEVSMMNQTIPHLEPAEFAGFTYPYVKGLPPVVTEFPVGDFMAEDPAQRKDPRANIYNFHFQRGNYLDYYTGLHEPSLSAALRSVLSKENPTLEDFKRVIPKDKQSLFPQLSIDANWPPTLLMHGTIDDAVLIDESRNLRDIIKATGTPVELIEVEGVQHAWDYFPVAETTHSKEFDAVIEFVRKYL
ncbi:alpha/beta-hydrolase [Agrocybe pediades]|nr:alpha/beta-hydrolase [Agrocybe pediades]